MVFVLSCGESKTDLLPSHQIVNMYMTFVFDLHGYACCGQQRSEVRYSCPMKGEVRYNWSGFKSFPRGLKSPSCLAHTGKNAL